MARHAHTFRLDDTDPREAPSSAGSKTWRA